MSLFIFIFLLINHLKTEKGKKLYIECKSAESTKPLYNSGGVNENYIYIFCSKKTNSTTKYMGNAIITIEQNILIDEHIKKARIMDEILNKKLVELDINKRGICYYTRPMINQHGSATYTNYMTHQNKDKDENNVFNYID